MVLLHDEDRAIFIVERSTINQNVTRGPTHNSLVL